MWAIVGFDHHIVGFDHLEQDINSHEYWLIPMKRWLHPDMTGEIVDRYAKPNKQCYSNIWIASVIYMYY